MLASRALLFLPIAFFLACTNPPDELAASSASGSGAGGGGGDGGGGAGSGGSAGSGGLPEPSGPVRYPASERHSPLSKSVVEGLQAVLASGNGRTDIVAKIGDSNTVNTGFMQCLDGSDVKLDAFAALEPTRAFFGASLADGSVSSYDRMTLAAKVGWSSGDVLAGNPSPVEQELAALTPAFAVVLLGTNDTYAQGVEPFALNMLRLVDELKAAGVVPLLTTLPQRADTAEAAALVPEMNAIVRGVAQAKQVPMLDLFGALAPIADFGLVSDGIHLQSYTQNGAHSCWFDPAGLSEGMNQRNLITLEALDRARRLLLENETPEKRPADLVGEGTWQSPIEIDELPFVDNRDTTQSQTSEVDVYSCSMANEAGPEIVYRLTLSTAKNLRIRVFDDANTDIDVYFMSNPGGKDQCIKRADKVLDVTAGPGTFWIAADTYVDAAGPLPGAYLMTVVEQ